MASGNNFDERSCWQKIFGRSLIKILFGDFFNQERNTASIIAIFIVSTLCYAAIFMSENTAIDTISKLIFAIVGYYFGSKSKNSSDENDDD